MSKKPEVTYTSSTVTYPPSGSLTVSGGIVNSIVTTLSPPSTTTSSAKLYGIELDNDTVDWMERKHPRRGDEEWATIDDMAREYFEERRAELTLQLEEAWHDMITLEEVLDLVNREINTED